MAKIIFEANSLRDLKQQFNDFIADAEGDTYVKVPAHVVAEPVATSAHAPVDIQPRANLEAAEPPKRTRRTKAEIAAAQAQAASPIEQPETTVETTVETPVELPKYTIDDVKNAASKAFTKHGSRVYTAIGQMLTKEFGVANFGAFDKPEHVAKYAECIAKIDAITKAEAI